MSDIASAARKTLLKGPADYYGSERSAVIRVYLLLALLSLAVFGFLHIAQEGNPEVGYLELTGAVVIALILLHFKLSANVIIARICFLLTIITLLIVMLTTGGTQGTGIFWFFMFPVAAFFLAGSGEGLLWTLLLLGIIGGTWAVSQVTAIAFYYSDITIRQLLATLFVVSVGLYVYQRSRERWECMAKKSQDDLKAYVRQMTELHAKLDRTKSEFLTVTSHQLRTPISAIRWFSEMLLNGDAGRLTSAQTDAVNGVQDANYRLVAIVDSMLTVSSLELGELYVRPEPTDLLALSHKSFKEMMQRYKDKEFVTHEEYAKNIPKLQLDNYIIRQLLKHLFSNACKYTAQGGTITVSIALSSKKLSKASAGSVMIAVKDTGFGIPDDQRSNVFVKLFRAENIKLKETDGTGLGLYIVKAMTDLVGGRVDFTSEEGKGSTFFVWLPLEGMKRFDGDLVVKGEKNA